MKRLIFAISIMLLSCDSTPTSIASVGWFDLPKFSAELVEVMATRSDAVSKQFGINGKVETKNFSATDSSFWSAELAHLLETDLNSARLIGAIRLEEGLQDSGSNLLIDEYQPMEESDIEFKDLKIYYLKEHDEIRRITLELASKNIMVASSASVIIWLNRYNGELLIDSMHVFGKDDVVFQDPREYQSTTRRIR